MCWTKCTFIVFGDCLLITAYFPYLFNNDDIDILQSLLDKIEDEIALLLDLPIFLGGDLNVNLNKLLENYFL